MGLFDTIINSYKPLGEKYLNATLQTKSLECLMDYYWISPNGELYKMDYSECFKTEDNPDYDLHSMYGIRWMSPFIQISTGKHSKLSPCYINKKVEMYMGIDNNSWTNIVLYFKLGQLQTYFFETHDF